MQAAFLRAPRYPCGQFKKRRLPLEFRHPCPPGQRHATPKKKNMKKIVQYRVPVIAAWMLLLLSACNNGPKTYDDCLLKASRESQSDRQFKKLSDACKKQYPDRGLPPPP